MSITEAKRQNDALTFPSCVVTTNGNSVRPIACRAAFIIRIPLSAFPALDSKPRVAIGLAAEYKAGYQTHGCTLLNNTVSSRNETSYIHRYWKKIETSLNIVPINGAIYLVCSKIDLCSCSWHFYIISAFLVAG